jgi:hypothetical protein
MLTHWCLWCSSCPDRESSPQRLESRSSVDLAAGLNRSPKSKGATSADDDNDTDFDYATGLFLRFRSCNSGEGNCAVPLPTPLAQWSLVEVGDSSRPHGLPHVQDADASYESKGQNLSEEQA